MGGNRIVVHPGSCAQMSRKNALSLAIESMRWALDALDENNLSDICVCPETMGKVNQLGTLDEVLALCSLDIRMVPGGDFGHLNARTFGRVQTKKDFNDIFEIIADRIGEARLKTIHIHFSKIEYTITGGEKKHLTFEDKIFGPDYFPMITLLVERKMKPIVICESDGTQLEDAAMMRNTYDFLRKTKNNE